MMVPPDQEASLTAKHRTEIDIDKNANDLRTHFRNSINTTMESFKKYNVTFTLNVVALSTIDKPDPIRQSLKKSDQKINLLTKIDIADAGTPVYMAAVEEKDIIPNSEIQMSYEVMYVYRHGGKWYVKSPSIL